MSENSQNEVRTLGFAAAKEFQENFKQVEEIMKGFAKSYESMRLDPLNLSKAYTEWLKAMTENPQKVLQANVDFWQKSMELTQQALRGMVGQTAEEPVIKPEKGDRRFSHEEWDNNPAFALIKQSYLLASQWLRTLVSDIEGLDEHTAERVKFFTERYLDALSPTNFALTNPAVLEKIRGTKGANLVHGLKNMLEDLEAGKGELRIRMTDTKAFELGKNVAVTPGKVVFQNRMFQLIQYTPATDKVLKRPLLIIPPWINKFYILDLQPKNSLLKWLVDQGHTVYVISWVNPDESYADTGFDDYVKNGVIEAVNAIQYDTGEPEINAIGYCIGGTLLASSLAYMKTQGDSRIQSATFFTTMLDFQQPGELGIFIDEEQIQGLESTMQQAGYLDGSKMAGTFNLLRANDLIWSFYVNNYLLGNDPRPFDLLYWNSDSTRMPANMHSWYLRNMYLNNNLCKPNAVSIDGTAIDLRSIDVPSCFISTVEDHIAPWKSTYSGALLFSGPTRFILGGSGHIAGIVNPPAANKYGYRLSESLPDNTEGWLAAAQVKEGSWWPEWDRWVRALNNEQVPARQPGAGQLKALEDAPGTYVKVRMDDPVPVVEFTVLPTSAPAAKPADAKPVKAEKKPAKVAAKTPKTAAAAKTETATSAPLALEPKPAKATTAKPAKPAKSSAKEVKAAEVAAPKKVSAKPKAEAKAAIKQAATATPAASDASNAPKPAEPSVPAVKLTQESTAQAPTAPVVDADTKAVAPAVEVSKINEAQESKPDKPKA